MNRASGDSDTEFTSRQGQYLAFIDAYTLVNGRAPAHADIQRFFRVTPPSVHQVLLTLEREGMISRLPECRGALPCWSIGLTCPRCSQDTADRSKSLDSGSSTHSQ
jgi:DNA-binding IclR family transcriptional regulator